MLPPPIQNPSKPLNPSMIPSTTTQTLVPSLSTSNRFDSPAGSLPTGRLPDWDEAYDEQRIERWKEKVKIDLQGWRGGHGYRIIS